MLTNPPLAQGSYSCPCTYHPQPCCGTRAVHVGSAFACGEKLSWASVLSGLLSWWLDIPQHLPRDHSHDSSGFLGVVVQSRPGFKGSTVSVSVNAHWGSLFPNYFTDLIIIVCCRQLTIYTLECEHNSHPSTDFKTPHTLLSETGAVTSAPRRFLLCVSVPLNFR